MRLAALTLLAALPALAACQGRPVSAGEIVAETDLTLEKVEAGYAQARAIAAFVLPMLAPKIADRVLQVQGRIEQALETARRAVTLAEQLTALRAARDATLELSSITAA